VSAVLYDVPGPRSVRRARIGGVIGSVVLLAILGLVVWRFASKGVFDGEKWEPFKDPDIINGIFEGYVNTLKAAGTAIACALVMGALLAVGRLSDRRWLRAISAFVVEAFRAVPLLLLILFLFLAFGDRLGAFGALVLGLVLYNGSVLAEIFRAGINAVPRGQREAAFAVGLRKSQVMQLVLVPQGIRIMLPAIISQCVVALKDTALGFVIGYAELLRTGRAIYDGYFNIIPVVFVIGTIYIATNAALSALAVWVERRQSAKLGAHLPDPTEIETGMGAT